MSVPRAVTWKSASRHLDKCPSMRRSNIWLTMKYSRSRPNHIASARVFSTRKNAANKRRRSKNSWKKHSFNLAPAAVLGGENTGLEYLDQKRSRNFRDLFLI